MTFDAIVVGSGPGGANATAALVERGRRVLMLDVGDVDSTYEPLIPPRSFREIRESDAKQHRYFLGNRFEGVPSGAIAVGAQLTPPRAHVIGAVARQSIESLTFRAAESHALGGLGAAWGAGVFPFDDNELAEWPIPAADLRPHYSAVARRIGVCAGDPELDHFFGGGVPEAMPPLEIDSSAERVLDAYGAVRPELNAEGMFVGRLPMAVCTRPFNGRGPNAYRDMDFWADTDRSVYRPRWTIEDLRGAGDLFRYAHRFAVERFSETDAGVSVTARNVDTGAVETFSAKALLIGAGTLGTARIVLRSLARYDTRVPILCNPYTYAPVLNLRMLGRPARDRRHSLAQLTAFYQPRREFGARGAVQTQLFSYRSLLTFRLMQQAPLGSREALRIMRALMPALGILGINHDDSATPRKHLQLRRDASGERLHVSYELDADERARIERNEHEVLRLFRKLGCWAIKRVHPGYGSSIHYAGTFPFRRSSADARQLATEADGRLSGTRAVYLVDGSSFPYLPAKGLTFTIMANANRVASALAPRLA
jgi:choline dehydrogenase-like flavoprotein